MPDPINATAGAAKLCELLDHTHPGPEGACFKCRRAARQILNAAGAVTENPDFDPSERAVARMLMPGAEWDVGDANRAEQIARAAVGAAKWHLTADALDNAAADTPHDDATRQWLVEEAREARETAERQDGGGL